MKTLLLIDANSLIHRAFHALPPFKSPAGAPSGALYGLSSILLKILKERRPDYIAAAFDRPEPTERRLEYVAYKATRPKTADELVSQLIESHRLLKAFGVRVFDLPGFEADDLLASLVSKFKKESDLRIIVFSGDLDLLQLVKDDLVVAETPQKGISQTVTYNEDAVKERFGLSPEKIPDYKGLMGEKSDNIPGVPGIGPKTASALINQFGSIENLYAELKDGLVEPKISLKLKDYESQALLSKKLAKLRGDIPLELKLEELKVSVSREALKAYFQEMGFSSLINRL